MDGYIERTEKPGQNMCKKTKHKHKTQTLAFEGSVRIALFLDSVIPARGGGGLPSIVILGTLFSV